MIGSIKPVVETPCVTHAQREKVQAFLQAHEDAQDTFTLEEQGRWRRGHIAAPQPTGRILVGHFLQRGQTSCAKFRLSDEPSGKTSTGKMFFHNLIPGSQVPTEIFYQAIIMPVIHCCMGGPECSVGAEVLNTQGEMIPGLYVAGEAAGGIHGNNRLDGSSLLDCVVFGRVSGAACAKYMLGDRMKVFLLVLVLDIRKFIPWIIPPRRIYQAFHSRSGLPRLLYC